MTALEIAKLVRQECGIAGANSPASFTGQTGEMKRVVDWVTQADLYIQSLETDWRFLWSQFTVNTVAGTAGYAVPTDFDEWDPASFYLDYTTDDYVELEVFHDYRAWRKQYRQGVKANEIPSRLVILPDDSLILDNPPDDVYSLTADYYRKPIALAADADEPPYPARYHRLVVARAKRMYAAYEDAPEILEESENEFKMIYPRFEASQLSGQKGRYNADFAEDMVVVPE